MREIKFKAPVYDRALHKSGHPYAQGQEPVFVGWVTFDLNSIGITNTDGESVRDLNGKDEWDLSCVDLDKSRLYTGRKDKNGVEIYRGDIVEKYAPLHTATDELTRFVNVIEWNTESYGGGWSWLESGVKVIGNIYENPELLEDKGE